MSDLRDVLPKALRLLLMGTLILGLTGTVAELLLLEHFEGLSQYVPIALIGVALLLLVGYAVRRSRATVRLIQGTMWAFVVAGLIGTWLHYKGNADFELELEPTIAAWKLFTMSMMGATPVLAPGAMIQLGLIGLAWSFRHPALGASAVPPSPPSSESAP
jgi:tellurite resistance protein TehA-like permease